MDNGNTKALMVIDMQEDYVGENRNMKKYPYDAETLILNINAKIQEYQKNGDLILYVRNRKKLKRKDSVSELTKELSVTSNLIFDKDTASCFLNETIVKFLKDNDVNEIETVGVDGNYCVGLSALGGNILGYSVTFPCSCIGILNTEKFIKMKQKLIKSNILICE